MNSMTHHYLKDIIVKPSKTELVLVINSLVVKWLRTGDFQTLPFNQDMLDRPEIVGPWFRRSLEPWLIFLRRRCDGMITDKYENQFSRSDKAASLLPLFSSGSCPGTNIQFRKCPLRPCSSKDSTVSRPSRGLRYGMEGIWSEWTEWSSCSKSCGTGLKTRNRKCMEGACRGLSEMPKKCKKKVCPVFNPKTTIMKFVHEKDKPCGALKEWFQCT